MFDFVRAVRHPYINSDFTLRGSLRVRIMERPGLWLDQDGLDGIVAHTREVVLGLGKGTLDYGVVSGSKAALDRSIITLITDGETGRAMGFNALVAMDCVLDRKPVEVVHLGLAVVHPDFHSRGLGWVLYGLTTFILFFKRRLSPIWISNVTQVPSVFGMVSDSFDDIYPGGVGGPPRTFEHLRLVRQIMRDYRFVFGVSEEAGFDEEHFVITDAYTGGSDNLKKTWDEAPKHRKPRYNDYCHEHLDYARGDDFIQIGRITLYTFWYYIYRTLPRVALFEVSSKLVYVMLASLVIPPARWLAANTQMGELRPWRSLPADDDQTP